MLQAPVLDGLSFDPFPFQQDGLAAPGVDIGGREVIQALVVTPVVVVLDEDAELGFEITGQIIVQIASVFSCSSTGIVPPDAALGNRGSEGGRLRPGSVLATGASVKLGDGSFG